MPDVMLLYTPHFNTNAKTSLAFSFAITWERHTADSQVTEAKSNNRRLLPIVIQ